MSKHSLGAEFIDRISAEAQDSTAVNHPYLDAMSGGHFSNVERAFEDFALQYGLYSAPFTQYMSVVIDSLSSDKHKDILLENLAEEQGEVHDIELPADVLASIAGKPHTELYLRFQNALGVDADYEENTSKDDPGHLWSQQFLLLCKSNQHVGVGAIGIGTELIVSQIYSQILEGLKGHSNLTPTQHVFFDLHSQCDDEHAAQMMLIAEDLALDQKSCEQIEYGVTEAIRMRTEFWDRMLERAQDFPVSNPNSTEQLSSIGYKKGL